MPLHLLGKKSWNVYNADNIARVRRDEAEVKAREEAEEQRQQEIDAERRLAILRGEDPPPLPPSEEASASRERDRDSTATWGRERRKRKRAGEDDTDFELRLARERKDTSSAGQQLQKSSGTSNAPLIDAAGHVDLFPQDAPLLQSQKNPEAEKETARKKKEFEDQYTMRFSNAAGNRTDISSGPWYADGGNIKARDMPGKDVWGNEDLRRKDREATRIVMSDPLAMMKRGAAKVREVEKERRTANEEKEKELRQLRKEEKRKQRRRRRGEDDLEGFRLDDSATERFSEKRRRLDEEKKQHNERRHDNDDNQGRHRHRSEHRRRENDNESRPVSSQKDHDHEKRDRHLGETSRRKVSRTDHY